MAFSVSLEKNKSLASLEFFSDKANTLERNIISKINDLLDEIENDSSISAVVISSKGNKIFSSGADLREYNTNNQKNIEEYLELLGALLIKLQLFSKVVIVKVNGISIGGALGLIAASDYVLSSNTSTFTLPELKLGIAPSVITPFLINRIGCGHLKNLSFGGLTIDAFKAETIGLVSEVVVADKFEEIVKDRCLEISSNPYTPVKTYKEILSHQKKELYAKIQLYSKVNAENILNSKKNDIFVKKS